MSKYRMWAKKPLARRQFFVQTPFSHSNLKLERESSTPQCEWVYFKIRAKKSYPAKPLAFSLHFLWPKSSLQFDFKNHENVWTDLKDSAPIQFKFFEL